MQKPQTSKDHTLLISIQAYVYYTLQLKDTERIIDSIKKRIEEYSLCVEPQSQELILDKLQQCIAHLFTVAQEQENIEDVKKQLDDIMQHAPDSIQQCIKIYLLPKSPPSLNVYEDATSLDYSSQSEIDSWEEVSDAEATDWQKIEKK